MYKMELRTNEKVLLISMSGMMNEIESIGYIEELRAHIRSINPMQYNIVIDARELKTSPQNLTGYIERAMLLITHTPFKKRFSIMPQSVIATSQVKRVAREDDKFEDTILVESYSEVLRLIA